MDLNRASYYKWLSRTPNSKAIEDKKLVQYIIDLEERHHYTLGYRRVTGYLNKELGTNYNQKKIRRLMRVNNIMCVIRPKRLRQTTPSEQQVAENILNRQFEASRPNEKWCTDITEIIQAPFTNSNRLYLSAIIDLYDNSIVHYELSTSITTDLVLNTLSGALEANPGAHPMIHTDRGAQYTSYAFKNLVSQHKLTHSMSRVGSCLDNAPIERFWGTLKAETYYSHHYRSEEEFTDAITGYFDYYNYQRYQERFGMKAPMEVRSEALGVKNPKFYPIPFNKKLNDYKEMLKQAA